MGEALLFSNGKGGENELGDAVGFLGVGSGHMSEDPRHHQRTKKPATPRLEQKNLISTLF